MLTLMEQWTRMTNVHLHLELQFTTDKDVLILTVTDILTLMQLIGALPMEQMHSSLITRNGLTKMVMAMEITWLETILTVVLQWLEPPPVTDTVAPIQIWIHSLIGLWDGPSHKVQMHVSMSQELRQEIEMVALMKTVTPTVTLTQAERMALFGSFPTAQTLSSETARNGSIPTATDSEIIHLLLTRAMHVQQPQAPLHKTALGAQTPTVTAIQMLISSG
tara:strand:- start:4 stop:663 length:660 start_codon:yes stop_codon:yes gene_type:complete